MIFLIEAIIYAILAICLFASVFLNWSSQVQVALVMGLMTMMAADTIAELLAERR